MAQRLTSFSKLLIVLVIVSAAFFGVKYLLQTGVIGGDKPVQDKKENSGDFSTRDDDVIKVGVVTWGGYAGGQYFNEGFKASKTSRFYQDYGLKVEFVVNDDLDASLNAWKNGDIDLHWYTIDAFPTIIEGLRDFDPVALWQADWSRGGDAIVVRRGIKNASDLRGKKVAVAELTPSHSFLLYLLDAAGLTADDIQVVPQASAVDAAAAFKSQQVDAAVVWSPDDLQCVRDVPGSIILESSRGASHIIADFFFAKRAYADANRDKLQKLFEGWMIGAAEINSSAKAKDKAAKILADGLGLPEEDAVGAIDNVRLATFGDNKNFFGLNTSYSGVTGNDLYLQMATKYKALGFTGNAVPTWRQIAYPAFVQNASLSGTIHEAEKSKSFTKLDDADAKDKEAVATKRVSINFRTGEYILDENAKYIIDKEFIDIAKAFGNARIRIEGNTDNVGSAASNKALSKRRAQSVANYLIKEHGMDVNRIIVIGNGPDKPVASNDSEDGRAKNRRTDFELVKD
ncbi:MAG: OmpA family protein [Saprospiraceae bacterium]|nr:OmpA family protein [Saprospiraceae bacterium]MCB9322618.1 OmpA family protein [Lewinellaceae bacterium]